MTALDAAIAAHLGHPAASQQDGLTESLCDQAYWASRPFDEAAADFAPTVVLADEQVPTDLAQVLQRTSWRVARKAYVAGVRAGRLAGFAWGALLGAGAVVVVLRVGILMGG